MRQEYCIELLEEHENVNLYSIKMAGEELTELEAFFEKFPEGPDFPAYLHPGRGLSLGVARELVQAEEVGGRPVRKRQNLIHIKSNTFCVHFR